jgi:hypothetical protein
MTAKTNNNKIKRSQEFKDWFLNSKVVDDHGQPMVVYHSTNAEFSVFSKTADIGFHFGTADQAQRRAQKQGNDRTLPVYLSIQNPIEMPDLGDWDFWRFTEDGMYSSYEELPNGNLRRVFSEKEVEEVAEKLSEMPDEETAWEWMRQLFESKGFDGIKYQNVGETENEEAGDYSYIAFRPNQIKSAIGLRRQYDRNSADFTI